MIRVTSHAIARYRERVRNVSIDVARAALSIAAVQKAAEIGAPFVKLGTGQRIVIERNVVVTVLPSNYHPTGLSRERQHLCSNMPGLKGNHA